MKCEVKVDNGKESWLCGRPAKFIVPDERRHLCGRHMLIYNRFAKKKGKPAATPL